MATQWQSGERNLITDVQGLLVGNASDSHIKTGVTVLTARQPFIASVDVMGGAPGTRDTELLAPDKMVQQVDALVLSGGSAFGLDAASGVMDVMRSEKRGFEVGPARVPIVPAAIVFDLINGGDHRWSENPYALMGRNACRAAASEFELGTAGAGTGATTATMKGGLGSASLVLPDGSTVGALVVANPYGHVTVPGARHFWAAAFEMDDEFGGHGLAQGHDSSLIPVNDKFSAYVRMYGADKEPIPPPQGMNTTIAIVATDVALSKSQLKRFAVAAQDGMARAIVPSHTPFDGDLVFAVSTAVAQPAEAVTDTLLLGHAAAVCLSRAIARGVYHASSFQGDTLPSWQSLYS